MSSMFRLKVAMVLMYSMGTIHIDFNVVICVLSTSQTQNTLYKFSCCGICLKTHEIRVLYTCHFQNKVIMTSLK